ncbi:MAG: hypothetical protein ACRBBJ_04150 [Rhodomicrobiaceae bacterium]|jgi:hypothetical protein
MFESLDGLLTSLFGPNGGFLGLLTILVGIFSLLHAYISYRSKTILDSRNRTTLLFEELYSVEGYSAIVAPVFNIMLKWNGLSEPAKSEYQKVIIDGWVGFENAPTIKVDLFCESMKNNISEFHYKKRKETGEITEHEALTAFLYFWSKLDLMLTNKVIDSKLTKSLFKVQFNYYRSFIKDLRTMLDENINENDFHPAWYDATLKLEKFFGTD